MWPCRFKSCSKALKSFVRKDNELEGKWMECQHKYEDIDWNKMKCRVCHKTTLEILCVAYGPNWRNIIRPPDDCKVYLDPATNQIVTR